jgi:hypothetical protein
VLVGLARRARRVPGTHFAAYTGDVFEQIVHDQAAFLQRHLAINPVTAQRRGNRQKRDTTATHEWESNRHQRPSAASCKVTWVPWRILTVDLTDTLFGRRGVQV